MAFQVEAVAFELIGALRPLLPRVKGFDRSLADQLTRAASSAALNIAESNYSDRGNRKARLFTAAGSANETRAALRLAVTLGYCEANAAEPAERLVDRVIAMLWKLTRR
jgi:four helix bundle protein